MKHTYFFALLLSLLLIFTACGGDTPVMADTQDGTDTSDTTDTSETESETEPLPQAPKKRVAITFDDGPAYDTPTAQRLTYKIVDEFKKYNGAATFFFVGNRIGSTTGEAIRYAHDNGCELAIHAYTHDVYFDECPEDVFLEELRLTKEAIQKYAPEAKVSLLRAPGGYITDERALLAGYPVINWSIDSEDWRYKSRSDEATTKTNINTIVENALRNVEDGDIILMHELYLNSYEATCIILERLSEMGFEFVTVSELIGADNLKAGKTYYAAP